MDFVHDQLATGKKIRVLTVVDTFSATCLCSIPGSAVGPRRGQRFSRLLKKCWRGGFCRRITSRWTGR